MNKIVKRIIFIIIVISIIVALIIIKKTIEKSSVVPDNPPNAVGNSAGNLYNGGFFAEADGVVYFANPYDNGAVYAMEADGSLIRRIAAGNVSYITTYNDYVYFYSLEAAGQTGLGYVTGNRGIFRVDANGRKCVTLAQATSDSCMLLGNRIYYTVFEANERDDGNARISIHSVTINGTNEEEDMLGHYKLGATYEGNIIFGGYDDHNLYSYNPQSGTTNLLLEGTVYLPIYQDGLIYYLDITDNYKIKAYDVSAHTTSTIVSERVDTYNMYGDYIYYQNVNPDEYALKRINLSSGQVEVVRYGVYRDLNVTHNYLYFREFGNDVPVYKTPTLGPINVTSFDEAMMAVMAN